MKISDATSSLGQEFDARGIAAQRGVLATLASNFGLLVITSLVFVAPNILLASALGPIAMAAIWVGCVGVAAIIATATRGDFLSAPIDLSTYALSAALGLAVCLLGGEGHIFFSTTDWLIRDAVLADVVKNGVGALYRYEGQDYLLRAPLGMYLTPALIGARFGLNSAHFALLAQNAFLLGSVLYFVARMAQVNRVAMLLLFIVFSGADIVPVIIAELNELVQNGAIIEVAHIEFWVDYFTTLRLQYSSPITQWFWVPNHAAPAWWFMTLAMLYARREIDLSALLAGTAALLLWSPLAMMGAAPFVAFFVLTSLRALISVRFMLTIAAGLCFVPVALYLTMDSGEVPRKFLLSEPGFWVLWPLFIVVELPALAIIAYAWRKVEEPDRRLVQLAAAMLLIIPIYSIGVSNDFVMRASMPALFILAYCFCRIAVLTPRDNGTFATVISVTVILGFATPMLELKAALKPAWTISDCNLLTAWHKNDTSFLPTNYWARLESTPAWLIKPSAPPLTLEDRQCWPDHPLLPEARR